MVTRRKPKGEWLWEQIAALKRGRLEPDLPAGSEELASASRLLGDALRVRVDPEREALSRYRLLQVLRQDARQQRVIVATHAPRSFSLLMLQVLLPALVIVLFVAAIFCLPSLEVTEAPVLQNTRPLAAPNLDAPLCAGSLSVLHADRLRGTQPSGAGAPERTETRH